MQHESKKIALFVDFDNIYLGLRETSREAAEAFATRPHVWLKWIEHGMPRGDVDHVAPRESRALIRQCYLNPDSFGKYRGYFTRAGFTVVDCPTLTSRGKNSSDIVMVMDILDALRHETRFDRFVIMSADADFTPVLQRLRAHDRRTAVMVSGLAAPAYRASCDKLIEEDVFIEHALELVLTPEPSRAATPAAPAAPGVAAIRDPDLLAAIGQRVYEEASSSGTLPASELPRILREFKEFTPTSNWLGYFSLQGLTEALLVHRPELRITDDDPWRIAVRLADEPAAAPAASADAAPPPAAAEPQHPDFEALRDRVVRLVARLVTESAEPVVMGKAAHAAIQEVGPLLTETRWLGKGTFKNLLLSAPELPFTVVASPLPGFVYDLERHQPPSERAAVDGLAELGTEMASLIRRMNQLTDAPKLTPRQYRVLWEVVAKELGRAPYNLMGTGKAVRDQCVERGEPIARQAITWVLRGLAYVGYRFFDPPHKPENLAAAYRGNLLNILRQAQVTLSEDEMRMLDEWLLAGPSEAPAPAPPPPPSRRRAAPADPDAASEPDYAAWADALLAGESGRRVSPTPEPDPVAADPPEEDDSWPPAGALLFEPMDAPPRPRKEEDFEWPPRDALLFEPMDARPDRRKEPMEWPPADALFFEPTHPEPTNGASADATAGSVDDSPPAAVIDPPADAPPSEPGVAPVDAGADNSSQPVSEMHDGAIPDERPAQPAVEGEPQPDDVVAADWELSTGAEPDQFPWEASEAEPLHVDALPTDEPVASREPEPAPDVPVAETAPASESEDTDVVSADWQLAEDSPAAAEAGDAPPPAVEATQDAAAAEDNPVAAEWQLADDPASAAPEAPTAPNAEAEPEAAAIAPADAAASDDIVTAEWQPSEGSPPATDQPSSPEPDSPPSDAPIEPARADDAANGEIVTAAWEPADASPMESEDADAAASASDPAPEPAPSAEPSADAPQPDANGIFTASWEPADVPAAPEPPDASSEEPAAPSAEPAVDAGAAGTVDDDVVTPQWEAVEPGGPSPADASPEPATQIDAFPPAAPQRDETPPKEGSQ